MEIERENGLKSVRGFLLDVSSSHVAIFDADSMGSRVIPLQGIALNAKPRK